MSFVKATKKQSFLRMALIGASGSGKTYSCLKIAKALAEKEGHKVAFVDTERGSAAKYADEFDFDVLELESFSPQTYVDAIKDAQKAGYKVLVIDSLTHAWSGKDGALELVDRASKRSQSGNSFTAWREVTPQHNMLIDAILNYPGHVFATMRVKTEYVMEEDGRGKKVPKKIGLAPVQREGMEYEFDVVGTLDDQNYLAITKTRCKHLSGQVIHRPGEEIAETLHQWLRSGEPGTTQLFGIEVEKSFVEQRAGFARLQGVSPSSLNDDQLTSANNFLLKHLDSAVDSQDVDAIKIIEKLVQKVSQELDMRGEHQAA